MSDSNIYMAINAVSLLSVARPASFSFSFLSFIHSFGLSFSGECRRKYEGGLEAGREGRRKGGKEGGREEERLLLWSNSGWSRGGGGGDDICSPPLLQDQMESFAELIFDSGDQKTALVQEVVNHLVAEQDVYACGTLSVHLVDGSQRKVAHTRHLADEFCGGELLEVKSVIHM